MRILHFSSAKTWRGGEQQIAYLYEELTKKALQQWIFCVQDSAMASYCIQKKIPHFIYQKRFAVNPLVVIQLKNLCKKLDVDLVHLHDAHSHTFGFISTFFNNNTSICVYTGSYKRKTNLLLMNRHTLLSKITNYRIYPLNKYSW